MIQRAQRFESGGRIDQSSQMHRAEPSPVVERRPTSERCDTFVARYERQRPTLSEIVAEAPPGLYSAEQIEHDTAYERRLVTTIQQDAHSVRDTAMDKRSRFAEAFVATRIVDEEWFGADCEVFTTTRYDDIGNGVDFVLEWRSQQEDADPYRLAVDVTTALSSGVLEDKAWGIERSIRGVSGGKHGSVYLSEVRYYRSPHTDSVERLSFLPKVIMSLTKSQVDQAVRLVEAKHTLTDAEREQWAMPMINELLVQLQHQSILAMDEVCKKYRGFASLIDADVAAQLDSELADLDIDLRYAATTGQVTDVFAAYDRFVTIEDSLLRTIQTPEAYRDSIFVVHSLVPVAARMYQTQLEQKKRFASSGVNRDNTKRQFRP